MEDHLSHNSVNHMMKAKVHGHGDPVGIVHATVPKLCIDLTHRSWPSANICYIDKCKKDFKQKSNVFQFAFLIYCSGSSLGDESKKNKSGVKVTSNDGRGEGMN